MSGKGEQTTEQQQQTEQKKDGGKKCDSTPAPAGRKPKKAEAVLTKDEIQRVIDLGLGRGVDATNPKPWLNKSSFQVRRVAIENVIGTEEGGALQSYEREVTSVQTNQTDLKASVAIPQSPVTIGVDAEQSRSVSSRRRAVGQKVTNRTISFRADFEDAPSSSTTNPEHACREASIRRGCFSVMSESDETVEDAESALTFEERLSRWIMQRVNQRREMRVIEENAAGRPVESKAIERQDSVDSVSDLASVLYSASNEERKAILKDCRDFVHHFRITHYVCAIELGAAEYRVLTETEYYNRIGAAGSLGVESIGSAAIKETVSWKKTNKQSDLKRIGVIDDGFVARGTHDEAVVGVATQPISSLVRLRYLQLALRKALLDYIQEQGDSSGKDTCTYLSLTPCPPPYLLLLIGALVNTCFPNYYYIWSVKNISMVINSLL